MSDIIVTAPRTPSILGYDSYDIWQFVRANSPEWTSSLTLAAASAPGDQGSQSNDDAAREAIFYEVVRALVQGTPRTKDAVATAVTWVRNLLLTFTSLEFKAQANAWIDQNVQSMANWAYNDYMGIPQSTDANPLRMFRAMFGGPSVDLDWDD